MTHPTIGIIGSGNIGSGVARLASAAGLDVVLGNSRGPSSLVDLVSELGDRAGADTVAGVARRGDLVVLALPLAAYRDLPVDELVGKVVIDATNYYPEYTGALAEMEAAGHTSSEVVQRSLPGATVVKALNNVDFVRLVRLPRTAGAPDRSALPISGDSPEAKAQVAEFLDLIGFDSLDLGVLSDGWRAQPGAPLYVTPYSRDLAQPSDDPGQRFMEAETVPVPLMQARELAAQATKS